MAEAGLAQNSWFRAAILDNRWLWSHMIGCAIMAKVFLFMFDSKMWSIIIVSGLAVAWELWQVITEGNSLLDAIGDVVLGILSAVVVVA